MSKEILVVTSKMKKYLSDEHGLRSAGDVAGAITDLIERELDLAAAVAKGEKRKTVMGRDIGSHV